MLYYKHCCWDFVVWISDRKIPFCMSASVPKSRQQHPNFPLWFRCLLLLYLAFCVYISLSSLCNIRSAAAVVERWNGVVVAVHYNIMESKERKQFIINCLIFVILFTVHNVCSVMPFCFTQSFSCYSICYASNFFFGRVIVIVNLTYYRFYTLLQWCEENEVWFPFQFSFEYTIFVFFRRKFILNV